MCNGKLNCGGLVFKRRYLLLLKEFISIPHPSIMNIESTIQMYRSWEGCLRMLSETPKEQDWLEVVFQTPKKNYDRLGGEHQLLTSEHRNPFFNSNQFRADATPQSKSNTNKENWLLYYRRRTRIGMLAGRLSLVGKPQKEVFRVLLECFGRQLRGERPKRVDDSKEILVTPLRTYNKNTTMSDSTSTQFSSIHRRNLKPNSCNAWGDGRREPDFWGRVLVIAKDIDQSEHLFQNFFLATITNILVRNTKQKIVLRFPYR